MTSCIGRSLAARLLGRFFVGADREAGKFYELQPLQRFKTTSLRPKSFICPFHALVRFCAISRVLVRRSNSTRRCSDRPAA